MDELVWVQAQEVVTDVVGGNEDPVLDQLLKD